MTRYWKLCHACSQGNGEVVAGTRAARIQMARLGLWKGGLEFLLSHCKLALRKNTNMRKEHERARMQRNMRNKAVGCKIHDTSCKTRQTLQVIYYSSTSSGRAHCKPIAFSEIKQIPPAPTCKVKGLCDARISLKRCSRVFGNLT